MHRHDPSWWYASYTLSPTPLSKRRAATSLRRPGARAARSLCSGLPQEPDPTRAVHDIVCEKGPCGRDIVSTIRRVVSKVHILETPTIIRIKPGRYFVFVDSQSEFEAKWTAARQAGEFLRVLAVQDERHWGDGFAHGELEAADIASINPENIDSFELVKPTNNMLYRDLVTSFQASRPPEEQAEKAAFDERALAEKAQSANQQGAEVQRRLAELAALGLARNTGPFSAHDPNSNSEVTGVLLASWTWTGVSDPEERVPKSGHDRRGLLLLSDGSVHRIREREVWTDMTALANLARKIIGGRRRPPGRENQRLAGKRWESLGAEALSQTLVRKHVVEAAQEFEQKHGLPGHFAEPEFQELWDSPSSRRSARSAYRGGFWGLA